MIVVGEKIRVQRVTKNYTQEYMAFELGISQAAYSKIERDVTDITLTRLFDIAEILEVSPFVLVPKPKYGTGINQDALMRIWIKTRLLWRNLKLKWTWRSTNARNSRHSDISKLTG